MVILLLLVYLALLIVIGLKLSSGRRRGGSAGKESQTGARTKYHTTCPHCGKTNVTFAESMPKSWKCSECACWYTPSGLIYASSQNQYDQIDAWDGLEQFVDKVLKATNNAGFITLENGSAYVCRPGNLKVWMTRYPCEGIDRAGELHLMLLCMAALPGGICQARNRWVYRALADGARAGMGMEKLMLR